jgi:hypothetical protein
MDAITLERGDFDPTLVRAGKLRRQEEHMDRCSTTSYLSSAASMQSTASVAQSVGRSKSPETALSHHALTWTSAGFKIF